MCQRSELVWKFSIIQAWYGFDFLALDKPFIGNFNLKHFHPPDSFGWIFGEHTLDEIFQEVWYFLRELQLFGVEDLYQFGDRIGLEWTVSEQHFIQNDA